VLWSQGQSDATAERTPVFAGKFERLVSSLRFDLAQPDLPFYFVQIGRLIGDDTGIDQWNLIQETQRKAELSIPRVGMVATVDESLVDLAHADAASLKRLGVRLANLACRDLFPQNKACANIDRGPRPVSAVYVENRDDPEYKYREKVVRVTFASLNGRLRSDGKVSGFSIHNGAGAPLPIIYAIDIDPADGKSILVRVTDKPAAGAVLRYGYGLDPYCNVVDEANMPLPAFGPMQIQ
jgi:sialate O-acetylesterase